MALTAPAPHAPPADLRLRHAYAYVQLAQLRLAHFGRRISERIGRGLRLGEGDHLADAVGAGHQHGEAVEPEGDAAMGRRTESECIEQEAELLLRFLRIDAEQVEHGRLHLLAVDAD